MNLIQLGIRRSGNHAISHWLFPMLEEFFYLNLNNDIGKFNSNDIVKGGTFNTLITFENIPLSIFEEYTKKESDVFLVMRNPLNILASTWVTYNKDEERLEEAFKRIYEYINFKGYIIIYDKWLVDLDYRKKTASRFDLVFNDENFSKVWGYGESHFGDKDYLNRYKQIGKHEDFWKFINVKELESLYMEYQNKNQ